MRRKPGARGPTAEGSRVTTYREPPLATSPEERT